MATARARALVAVSTSPLAVASLRGRGALPPPRSSASVPGQARLDRGGVRGDQVGHELFALAWLPATLCSPPCRRAAGLRSIATSFLRSSIARFGCTLHTRSSSVDSAEFQASLSSPSRSRAAPSCAAICRAGNWRGILAPDVPQPLLDLRSRLHLRDFAAIALVDFVRARLDVDFGGFFLFGEESFQFVTQFVEQTDIVGEIVEHAMNDRLDLAIQRIVLAHRRRPADAGLRERVDQQARRMRLLREERAVEHRRLQHRDLQPSDQRLDAVGQILGLEDEIEQHRDQLDGHRLELIGLARRAAIPAMSRRTLCMSCCRPANCTGAPAKSKPVSPCCRRPSARPVPASRRMRGPPNGPIAGPRPASRRRHAERRHGSPLMPPGHADPPPPPLPPAPGRSRDAGRSAARPAPNGAPPAAGRRQASRPPTRAGSRLASRCRTAIRSMSPPLARRRRAGGPWLRCVPLPAPRSARRRPIDDRRALLRARP